MSIPHRISPPSGAVYDEIEGTCRAESPLPLIGQSSAAPPETQGIYSKVSHSALLADAFGPSRPVASRSWGSPAGLSAWSLLSGPAACGGSPEAVVPGDPVSSATPQGPAMTMNAQPLRGNLNECDLSGGASTISVVWSVFNATIPGETGTFAYVRNGFSGGSLLRVSDEVSALHKFTTSATMDDGSSVVAYTKATGEDEPSSIVARRISASAALEGTEIVISAPALRATLPDAQLVATGSGFVAVYRDGNDRLMAAAFNADGGAQGSPQDLGAAPSRYAVNRDEDGRWILAEIVSDNQIRVRSFNGVGAGGVDRTMTVGGFPSSPNLSVAMQEGGTVMVAWNAAGGGIKGAVLTGAGDASGAPFEIRSSGLANTMALASDHRGNFVFAWEEGGEVLARIYNGTPSFSTPADFSSISTGHSNSHVQAHVSPTGALSLAWVHSDASDGETLQDMVRRDYQLNY